jgi:hypothetical protein
LVKQSERVFNDLRSKSWRIWRLHRVSKKKKLTRSQRFLFFLWMMTFKIIKRSIIMLIIVITDRISPFNINFKVGKSSFSFMQRFSQESMIKGDCSISLLYLLNKSILLYSHSALQIANSIIYDSSERSTAESSVLSHLYMFFHNCLDVD